MKKNSVLSVLAMLAVLLVAGAANAINVVINEVQVDDTTVSVGATNRLDVERDAEVEIEVRLTASQNVKDMEVQAFFSGYEYNDDTPLSDATPLFDADANVTYVKKLHIRLPDDVEEDDYLLRVIASNRNDAELIQNYRIKLDVPRHSIQVQDIILNPDSRVKAGSALLATVRLDNKGERDEDDVKVTVSIPQLGISASDYIDEIESDDQEETEEIYLRVPKCAKPGTYDVAIDVDYDEGHKSASAAQRIEVLADDTCGDTSVAAKPTTSVAAGSTIQDVNGGEGVIFPIAIQNNGKTSRSYTLSVSGLDSDLGAKVTPGNTVVVDAGQTKTLYLFISPRKDSATGMKPFTATITSGSDTVEQLALTVNVHKPTRSLWDWMATLLKAALVALIVVLVVLALILAFRKAGKKDDAKPQTYY
jgi:hypothetical protein